MVQVSNLSSRVKDIINNYYNVIIANNHREFNKQVQNYEMFL